MTNNLIQTILENKNSSNEYSLLILHYFALKKSFTTSELNLFIEKEELEKLSQSQKANALENLKKLRKNLKKEIQAYSKWITLNTKKNILKAKLNQPNLDPNQQNQIEVATGDITEKILNFNHKIFKLIDVSSEDDFISILDKTEPMYLKLYRTQKAFFDTETLMKINELDLSNNDILNNLTFELIQNQIFSMEDLILEELYESILEKMAKGFNSKKSKKPIRLFALLGDITKIELAALATFTRGVSL